MAQDENQREDARLTTEFLRTDAIERLKNQLELGKALLQSLTLVNGGAIVALFTLIGQQGDNMMIDPAMLKSAFAWFVGGLVLAIIAGFGGFMSQSFFQATAASQAWRSQAVSLGNEPKDAEPRKSLNWGAAALTIAALGAIGSLLCFGVGSWSALSGALRATTTTVAAG